MEASVSWLRGEHHPAGSSQDSGTQVAKMVGWQQPLPAGSVAVGSWAANRPLWFSVALRPWASGLSVCDGAAAPTPRGWEVKGAVFRAMKGTDLSVLTHYWRKALQVSPKSPKGSFGYKVPFLIRCNPYHNPS